MSFNDSDKSAKIPSGTKLTNSKNLPGTKFANDQNLSGTKSAKAAKEDLNKKSANAPKKRADKRFLSHKLRLNLVKAVIVLAALLFLVAPMSTNIPQADMFSMVTTLGIDKGENGILCTAEVVLPVESNGATGVTIVLSGEGKTLSAAIENLCISIGRTLDLSHCAIIVIGQDFAKEGVMDELRFLLSSGSVSPQIGLVLSGNEDAKEFVTKLNEYAQKLDVENLLKYTNYGSHNYSQSVIEFLRHTYSKSESAVMPCITMGKTADNISAVEGKDFASKADGDKQQGEGKTESQADDGSANQAGGDSSKNQSANQGGGQSNQDEEENQEEKQTVVERTEKIGAFKKGKLVDVWGAKEANGLAWSDPKTKFGHITLQNISYKDKTIDKLSCFLIKKKVKIKADFKDNQPVLTFKAEAHFIIEERFKLYDVVDSQNAAESKNVYPIIIKELENKISEYILAGLEASKAESCDVYLVNDLFYKHHKKEYQKSTSGGNSLLDNCKVEFKFDIKIN